MPASIVVKSVQHSASPMSRLLPVCLVLVTLAIFLPTTRYDLTNYDEKVQLVENEMVRSLSPANIGRIFTRRSITSYYPVRTLSFAMDYAIWGYEAAGYHLTNVLLQVVNVLLVFRLCIRLSFPDPGERRRTRHLAAVLGAALFAIHPVVVEPVAWIAGREELLMTLFALLCIHAHQSARAADSRAGRLTWRTATAFACAGACLSNAVAVIVPAILLAHDLAVSRQDRPLTAVARSWYCWAIAAATLAVKLLGNRTEAPPDGVLAPVIAPFDRLLIVLNNYWLNLSQLVWPNDLTLIYANLIPRSVFVPGVLLGATAVVLTLVLLLAIRRNGIVLFGLLWFLLALTPSSQVIPHHIFRADRFLYLPLAGLAFAATSALNMRRHSEARDRMAMISAGVVLAAFATRSFVQVPVWRNTITVFSHCIRLRPDEPRAYNNRGNAYADEGQFDLAVADYTRAIELAPEFARAHYNRGNAYVESGEFDRAIDDFNRAITLQPEDAEARYNRGLAHAGNGDLDAAIEDYSRALNLKPDFADAWYNRANVRTRRREWQQAISDFDEAIRLKPNWVDAHNNRGNACLEMHQIERAIDDFTRAIDLDPRYARAFGNRGNARILAGDADAALSDFDRALALQPDLVEALCGRSDLNARKGNTTVAETDLRRAIAADPLHPGARYRLGLLFAGHARWPEAAEAYREALKLRPEWPAVANNLAWLLATCPDASVRNGTEAVRLAEQASSSGVRQDLSFIDTLAAALAETGRFDDAAKTAGRAADLARREGREDVARAIDLRLTLYRSGQPYREPFAPASDTRLSNP